MKLSPWSRAALAALAVAACGGPAKVGTRPSWRTQTHQHKKSATQPPRMVEFAPTGAAVERYNGPPVTAAPSDPLADRIVDAMRDAAEQAGMPAPVADGRLFAAARDLAAVVPENTPIQYPAVEFALQRHGIIEPSPHLMVIWGPIDDPQAIMEQLVTRIPEILQAGPFTRIGVGSAMRGKDGQGAAILALQTSSIETDPIPRALPAGGSTKLHGRVHAPYQNPQLFVTRENGDVDELPVSGSGGEFRASLSCDQRQGRQQVEITAVDEHGSTVLANFPVWCGESPPTSMRIEYDPRDAETLSAADAEKRLLDLVNADRAQFGLPALVPDPAVAAVARAHSQEMYETGVVAHISPRTGSAADRVKAVHIVTPVVLENVARAYGVVEAEQGLMNSPGHRANILSKDATNIGVGVVVGEEVAGRRELFITQVFTFKGGKVDPVAAVAQVRKAISGVSMASEDPQLSRLAQHQADEVASGVTPADSTKHTSARANAEGLPGRYSRVSTAVIPVPKVSAFQPNKIFDAKITNYGVGIAQGPNPTLGDNAIYIVLLIAVRR